MNTSVFVGSVEAANSDAECAESVGAASAALPKSFGGAGWILGPKEGSFKTRLLAVFAAALISRRKVSHAGSTVITSIHLSRVNCGAYLSAWIGKSTPGAARRLKERGGCRAMSIDSSFDC